MWSIRTSPLEPDHRCQNHYRKHNQYVYEHGRVRFGASPLPPILHSPLRWIGDGECFRPRYRREHVQQLYAQFTITFRWDTPASSGPRTKRHGVRHHHNPASTPSPIPACIVRRRLHHPDRRFRPGWRRGRRAGKPWHTAFNVTGTIAT
jgi:hypothetical protein